MPVPIVAWTLTVVTRSVKYKILMRSITTHSLALEAAALFPAAGVDESRLPLLALPDEEDEIAFLRSGDVSTSVSTWSPPFFLRPPPPPLPEERRDCFSGTMSMFQQDLCYFCIPFHVRATSCCSVTSPAVISFSDTVSSPLLIVTLFRIRNSGTLPLAPSLGVVTAEEGVETEDVLALRLLLSTRLSRLMSRRETEEGAPLAFFVGVAHCPPRSLFIALACGVKMGKVLKGPATVS